MIIGESIFIGYSPEREDPGNVNFSTGNIPKVVSGLTESCCNLMDSFYSTFITTTVVVSSTKTAEMVKLLENIYRSVNIGLINEMKIIADKFGVDIFEVVDAAATKPFGYTAFYPGPGLGGHCIPVDPFYLSWKAKEFGYNAKFIELSGEINRDMPKYVVEKITKVLNTNKKSINDANVLILGVSYKKDIDDTRETPAKDIFELLEDSGAIINYHDPFVSSFQTDKKEYLNTELSINNIENADIVVLVTNHTDLDYEFIYDHSKSILDTRGQYSIKLEKVHRG
jgi:UDP-N-acetyl-D-glucosamine dehydrogenase